MSAETVADSGCEIAEGPLWHPEDERLYWIDIPEGALFEYDPVRDDYHHVREGAVVGGYTIESDGTLLFFEDDCAITHWDDGTDRTILDDIPDERGNRFNDVIADPAGRVFAGTMPTDDRLGSLYLVDTDGTYELIIDGIDLPNGFGFSNEEDVFYLTESYGDVIYAYDYDRETGALSRERDLIRFDDEPGMPDGLTVDSNGGIWSAQFGGGCIIRFSPDGTETDRIELPTPNVTSLIFGGPEYTDLYVTTAKFDAPEDDPRAGNIFRVDPGYRGVPEHRSTISSSE